MWLSAWELEFEAWLQASAHGVGGGSGVWIRPRPRTCEAPENVRTAAPLPVRGYYPCRLNSILFSVLDPCGLARVPKAKIPVGFDIF